MSTWYVSDSIGNDANSCASALNPGTPKKTIAAGCACAGSPGTEDGAGDTVQVAAGSYAGAGNEELVDVMPSGTDDNNRFTLKCVTDGACLVAVVAPSAMFGFNSYYAHYITIRGFDWSGGGGGFFSSDTPGTFHHVTVLNNLFHDAPDSMFIQASGADDILIKGNIAHDIADCRNLAFEGRCHGIYASTQTHRWIIEDNEIYNTHGYGIQTISDGHPYADQPMDFIIRRNNLHHNGVVTVNGAGIICYGNGHQIVNNLLWWNAQYGIILRSSNTPFLNNTVYNNGFAGLYIDVDNPCIDNLLFGNGGPGGLGIAGTATCTPNLANITVGLAADYYVDADAGDFHLIEGAPAIGVDDGVTTDYENNVRPSPPSIGAYEFSGAAPAPITGVPPVDNLDYTSGSIDGRNAGTHWVSPWQDEGSTPVTIEVEPSGAQGGSAAKLLPAAASIARCSRQFEKTDNGSFYLLLRSDSTAPSVTQGAFFRAGGLAGPTDSFAVRLGPSGNIQALNSGTYVTIGTYSADTWYEALVQLDKAGHPGQFRVTIDGGTPSSWMTMLSTFVDVLLLYNANPGVTLWISAVGVPMPAAVATGTISELILKKVLKDEDFDLGAVKVSLHTGPPGLFGLTEVTGGSYVRQLAGTWNAAASGLVDNASEILWASGLPVVTVTDVGLWSADGLFVSGRSLNAAKTITSGSARFSPGSLTFSVGDNFSTYLANKLLDYMLRGVDFTTAPVYGAIHIGALDTNGGGEITGGSYARQQLAIADWADTGSSLLGDSLFQLLYNADVSWVSLPAGTKARIGFWDASTNGNFLMWGPDITLPSDAVTAPSGQLSATITQTP